MITWSWWRDHRTSVTCTRTSHSILQKIAAIIRRFLESLIPPALQISIDQDVADRIISSRNDPSPYIFQGPLGMLTNVDWTKKSPGRMFWAKNN